MPGRPQGWTKASYDMNPADAARSNTYLSAAADAIIWRAVERFPGDAVMAVFEGRCWPTSICCSRCHAVQRAMH